MPVCGGGAPPVHGQLASLSYRIGASTVLSYAGASVYLGESVMNLATRGLEPTTLYAYMPDGVVSSRPWATRRPHDHPWCHRPERLRLDRRRMRPLHHQQHTVRSSADRPWRGCWLWRTATELPERPGTPRTGRRPARPRSSGTPRARPWSRSRPPKECWRLHEPDTVRRDPRSPWPQQP